MSLEAFFVSNRGNFEDLVHYTRVVPTWVLAHLISSTLNIMARN